MADDVAEPEDEDEEEPNVRRYCTLSVKTVDRLKKLKRKGTHGTSVPKIMTTMIEEGVRRAHKDGYLSDEDMA
jgi:hypothetical protein